MPPAILDSAPAVLRRFEARFSARSRARGVVYAAGGRVEVIDANDVWLLASVRGTEVYDVELDLRKTALHASCTCPYFVDSSEPCKHIWATLLVAHADDALPGLDQVRTLSLTEVEPVQGADPRDRALERSRPVPAAVRPPPSPRPEAPRAATSSWREIVAHATESSASPGPRRELRFVVDSNRTRSAGRLVVRPVERAGPYQSAHWRPARSTRSFERDAMPEHAAVLGMLEGLSTSSAMVSWKPAPDFDVPFSACASVAAQLCATGNARLDDPDGPALAWDPVPYVLSLEVVPEEHGMVVRGWLERGEERVAATDPALVVAGGLAFWSDRVCPVDDAGQFGWIAAERRSGPPALPRAEVDDLVEALLRARRAPAIRLPADLALAEVRLEGKPYALFSTRARDAWRPAPGVSVEAGVDYGGARAPLETRGKAVFDRGHRRLVLRDEGIERAARDRLEAVGARAAVDWADGEPRDAWTIPVGRLDAALRDLVADGWRVELDGRLRRARGDFAVSVTTGVDWLDVHVQARFGDVEAPFPELLAALKHRRRTVVLADGSTGEISDAEMERLRRWVGMSEAKEGALRFRKTQTALVAALLDGEERASFDAAFAKARRQLAAFDGVKAKRPARTLRGKLRGYQEHGLGWFEALRRFGFGGCLADDMGLGKTVQVLALLDARRQERPRPGPSLVVSPRSVLTNWVAEATRFTPGIRILVHDGPDRSASSERFAEADLVLTTYGLLRQDALALSRIEFDYVVLDEAQAIKTARTASAKAARLLRGRHRLALTGTPLENHLGELASLIDFLNPGALGTLTALASLGDANRRVDEGTRSVLARAVRPFFLRRTKREVAPELPERIEQTLACELPPAQRRLYDELHAHYRASLGKRVARDGVAKSTAHILEALLRLRQAACHPGLVDPDRRSEPSAKLDALLEQLETLRVEGQKALVFSQFTSLLAIVRDRLDERGFVYEYLDGSTRDRAERVARFQSDERCGVFLLSLKAGGVGLNLTAAEYVFLLDPWWNPAVEAQAIDRAHRIGQARNVFAYKLLATGTVEEKVAELQKQKRELAEAIFGEGRGALSGLTREDLEQLLA